MQEKLQEITKEALLKVQESKTNNELMQVNVSVLGKNGTLSSLMRDLRELPNEEKPKFGAMLNSARDEITNAIKAKQENLENAEIDTQLESEKIDVTIPVQPITYGTLHPIELMQQNLINYFVEQGFTLQEGTDIESDYYCFEALNVPKDHPARDAQDTFYFDAERILRVHTSATQIRTMEAQQPPIKMISTGKVYRVDEIDATHSPLFHQFELLVVDENLSMADLKGILNQLIKHLFGEKAEIRIRPSFFPFTEPSVEVDATCPNCGGKGCGMCKNTGYIELLGAGMVNPKVLENCGIDSTKYTGLAAGFGLDRMTMVKFGITDIRDLFENDINFLKQVK